MRTLEPFYNSANTLRYGLKRKKRKIEIIYGKISDSAIKTKVVIFIFLFYFYTKIVCYE